MSRIAYVNGQYRDLRDASVNIEDRGYQFADGVYEVCEVRGGQLVDFPRHMARLERSLRELRIAARTTLPLPGAGGRLCCLCLRCGGWLRLVHADGGKGLRHVGSGGGDDVAAPIGRGGERGGQNDQQRSLHRWKSVLFTLGRCRRRCRDMEDGGGLGEVAGSFRMVMLSPAVTPWQCRQFTLTSDDE